MQKWFAALLIGGLIVLGGCEKTQAILPPPAPSTPKVVPQSDLSHQMAAYFKKVQASFLVNDLLRDDGGGHDTPFTQRNLVDNFIRIALFDEYIAKGGNLEARANETHLRRWESPIQMRVEFGASVPLKQRDYDLAKIKSYTKRLSRLTGVPIKLTASDSANFHVLILNEDERRAIGPYLKQLAPGMSTVTHNLATQMDRSTLCLVAAFSNADSSTYAKSIAIIRGEHPDRLRLACIHEELAQGMGLANDSPVARPSIFNDTKEFGLLTRHDELLLKMLYDRRLNPGMNVQQARPIAKVIAAELLSGRT